MDIRKYMKINGFPWCEQKLDYKIRHEITITIIKQSFWIKKKKQTTHLSYAAFHLSPVTWQWYMLSYRSRGGPILVQSRRRVLLSLCLYSMPASPPLPNKHIILLLLTTHLPHQGNNHWEWTVVALLVA